MAQREKKEMELRAPESLTLCVNNCGFSGNPATNNMCQSCFQSAAAAAADAPPPPPSCSPRSAPIRSLDLPTEARKDAEEDDGPKAVKEAAAPAAASTPARQVNRCSGCRKRVGLAGFRCRCGGLFCGDHRYSDRHDCSFDYKTAGRTAIARQNPVVRAAKIVRI